MDYNTAQAALQELRLDAYDGVLRCFRDKSLNIPSVLRETIVTKLRLEFGITPDTHTAILTRAIQDESRLQAPTRGYAAPEPAPKSQPTRRTKGAGTSNKRAAVLDLNTHAHEGTDPATLLTYIPHTADGSAGRKRQAAEMAFRKVKRWWPNEGGWWDAVVTKYKPDTGACELVYRFGTTKADKEVYNMHVCRQDVCIMTPDFASEEDIQMWKTWN